MNGRCARRLRVVLAMLAGTASLPFAWTAWQSPGLAQAWSLLMSLCGPTP